MIADLLPIGTKESGKQESRNFEDLSGGVESSADHRESTESVSRRHAGESESHHSSGEPTGKDGLPARITSGSSDLPAQKIKQDAAYYRSYRVRNKGRIQKQERKRRERDRNKKWVVQTVTGLPDIGIKVLSEFQVNVAMRAFWAKRGMAVPTATMGGILPSVSDFNEEVSILQMRTCI